MKQLSNVRKADKAHGDDLTLTRWVKEPGRHTKPSRTGLAPADASRTRFPTRVLRVADMTNLLVSGHSNVKIGRDVRKGRLKGYWIYTLSLEERKTCPRSCEHWQTCYGNNMPFAKRVDHTDPAFLPALADEIAHLCAVKRGVLIRLHALGDFFSVEYVDFWRRMLDEHANLSIFGYTARTLRDPIGDAIDALNVEHLHRRWLIRFSNGRLNHAATVSIKTEADCPASAFVCPEQTNKTRCCATCGACWSTLKNVAFLEHLTEISPCSTPTSRPGRAPNTSPAKSTSPSSALRPTRA